MRSVRVKQRSLLAVIWILKRSRMYSMLLTAKASGKPVTVSYNDVGGCEPWDQNINVYRRIVRLSH
ncbi:hypothetical protein TUMSATVNIG1_54700 [Vibrio nigripulchritudo]|nr:hypothetical protein VNTUMSATTG_54310 [Vibrio nigripulchritudo]BDU34861.1 hypothetical protein TUMSATVNIG1_54700 [Vibrio nigripulchritudo]